MYNFDNRWTIREMYYVCIGRFNNYVCNSIGGYEISCKSQHTKASFHAATITVLVGVWFIRCDHRFLKASICTYVAVY